MHFEKKFILHSLPLKQLRPIKKEKEKNDRGLQICPQNSNRITYDPFFGQKLSKFSKIPNLAYFKFFIAEIGVKCYPI